MKNIQKIILSKYYLAVLFLASTAYLQAQTTPYTRGNLAITQDADIPSNVTTITRITGSLIIRGTITTFPNFAALEVVELNLNIDGITTAGLIALSGIFPALDSVRGDLQIENQTVVETISGFAELDSVGGTIQIGRFSSVNQSLRTLSGFAALTRIGGALSIQSNVALTTLPSFAALKTIGDNLSANDNDVLTTLPTFAALTSIGGNLSIPSNATLNTISGFDVLETINGALNIGSFNFGVGNPALTSLPSFPALKSVRDLSIRNNNSLTTVSGFDALTRIVGETTLGDFISGGDFEIENNPKLTTISGFSALTTVVNNLHIRANRMLDDYFGLDVLETINGGLNIGSFNFGGGNPALTSLPSFPALTNIGGLSIIRNEALTTVSGFGALMTIGGRLSINNNAKLATVSGFDALTSINGRLSVSNNDVLTSIPSFSVLQDHWRANLY